MKHLVLLLTGVLGHSASWYNHMKWLATAQRSLSVQHLVWLIKMIFPCSTESRAFVSLSTIKSRWHVSAQQSSQALCLVIQSVEVICLYLTKSLGIFLFWCSNQAFQFTFIMEILLTSNAYSWATHVHFRNANGNIMLMLALEIWTFSFELWHTMNVSLLENVISIST